MSKISLAIAAIVSAVALAGGGGALAAANADMQADGRAAAGNANTLDGMDSKDFAYAKGKTRAFDFAAVAYDTDGNGLNEVLAASGRCPKGTQVTGGGGGDNTSSGITILSAPDSNEGWIFAVFVNENAAEDPENVFVSIVCYSPHGKNWEGSYRPTQAAPSERAMETIRQAALSRLR